MTLVYTLIIIASLTIIGSRVYRCLDIKNNLEAGAINCGWRNNFPLFTGNTIRNKDTDKNGKYESLLIYKDGQGNKMYQEIQKNSEGRLILGEPQSYK